MGRKKSRLSRAGVLGAGAAAVPDAPSPSSSTPNSKRAVKGEARRDVCVEVDRSTWGLPDGDHRDLAELVLRDVRLSGEGMKAVEFAALHEKAYRESRFSLRLRVRDAPEEGFRLGQWPVVPSDCVLLEFVIGGDHEKKDGGFVVSSVRQDCWKWSFLIYFLVSDHINFVQQIGWFNVKKGNPMVSSPYQEHVHCAPYCVPIDFICKNPKMFYNPFKYYHLFFR